MTDRYAVMGNPIAHSKSPQIHGLFARQTGQDIGYEKILVALDGFAAAVAEFQRLGGKGLNVTVPFKQEAWALMGGLSERARAAGAVNTIVLEADGRLFGDNTDGTGLVHDLRDNHGVQLTDRRVLLLGAGGAARGVIPALLDEIPAAITIANRTGARAQELAELFGARGALHGCGLDALGGRFDIVINATSAGLSGELPALAPDLLADGAVCYDMVYGDGPTAFQQWAQRHGARLALDGLGMLVEQAAAAFQLWRGIRPDTAPVIAALRQRSQ